MKIINLSEWEAKDFTSNIPYIHIVIGEPKTEPIKLKENIFRCGKLTLSFHDLDSLIRKYKLFNREDAKLILDFVELFFKDIELIVVNCSAGISRSAGVAGALSKLINGDDAEYFKHSQPNMLVYRTILNVANDINWRK